MPIPEALVTLWTSGAWLGSAFAGGVIGNLVASVIAGTSKWVSQPLLDKVPNLARLLSTGGQGSNHDILRCLRRAECAVVVALCDQTLLDDHGLRTGQGPLVERLRSRLHERQDPDVAALCRIRREFRRTWEDLKTLPVEDLARLHGTALTDVATLVKARSECLSVADPDDLRGRVVQAQLDGLEAVVTRVPARMGPRAPAPQALAPGGLPESLRRRIAQHPNGWWDLLRLAFREELKDPENERARIAWQLDVLSLLSDLLGRDHQELEQTVAGLDAHVARVWNDLAGFRAEFDLAMVAVAELLSHLLDEVRDTRAEMHERFDRVDEALAGQQPGRPPLQLPPRAFAREFFGRQELLADLTGRLRRREDVCVWGPAGMGKTALAAEAVRAVVGDSEETLARSPYPDGVVLLDLYQLHGDQTATWDRLASAFEPTARTDRPARDRAEDACRGRRALVIIEGAEEVSTGEALHDLLAVLAPESTRLALTRYKAQVFAANPLEVDTELDRDDAVRLLTKLTDGRVAASILAQVFDRLGGHPLALTWAGSQLASGDEAPTIFLRALESATLPSMHELGYERHTLGWLYERSVTHLSEDSRVLLSAMTWLAPTSLPLSASVAVLAQDGDDGATRARAALKTLVRHGLLRLRVSDDEQWDFTHALVYRFARETRRDQPELIDRLSRWACPELAFAAVDARHTGNLARFELIARHAIELLREPVEGLEPVAAVLVYEVQVHLNALARIDLARATLDAALGWMTRLPTAATAPAARQRNRSMTLLRIGDVRVRQGQLAAALAVYEEALTVMRRLAGADPHNAEWQRDVSVSLNRLGDVLVEQGRVATALTAYEEGLAVMRRLVEADPENAEWQRDVSVSLERVGDVQKAQGQAKAALEAYEQGLTIRRRLATADPENAQLQRDVSVSLDHIGDVRLAQGEVEGALKAYEEERVMLGRLVGAEPGNAEYRRDVSVSINKVGDVRLAQGQVEAALVAYEEGLEVMRRLARADPENAGWQRDVSVLLSKVANVRAAQGEVAAALATYEEALRVRRGLAEADPQNAQWQRDLSFSLTKLADLSARLEKRDIAIGFAEESLAIDERLAALDPSNAVWQNDVRVSRALVARLRSQ